ncbi:MAG: response regulator transcription factor [Phycisphaerae bacterium]|nr:response regulator transcription factor [Phycisphaerae bacterium]
MIRVVIADDHAIVREGIRRTLADTPDIQVTGEAGDGRALLAALTRNPADVVLLDLAMPGTPGLELLEELRRRNPSLPVLVLSMYPAEQYAVRAIQAGAAGYINKASPPSELLAALRAVAVGHRYISPDVAESLAMHLDRSAARNPHNGLSNREYEVMCLIARGRSASEIADSLGLSVKTVSTYRRRILEKLNLIQNAEITRYAIEHALIE